MKNKILTAGILATIIIFANTAHAVGQNSNAGTGTGNQVKQQIQTSNQGEESQIQVQNNTQTQSGTANQAGTGAQTQNQNQQQTQSQGEENQIQNQEQEKTQTQTQTQSATAEQRRSRVANAVQQMLQISERNGGIGQQVKTIAQTQTQNQEKLEASLQKIQSRGKFAKFFIGPNYNEINSAQKVLEKNQEQIKQLNQIKTQLSNPDDAQTLTQQIQILEQVNLQIENSLQNAQKEFSLFGWMFKLFSK